jgi:hypothetical protein
MRLALDTLALSNVGDSDEGTEMAKGAIAQAGIVAADLAGPNPSPARQLTAEAAAFAWLELWILNMKSAAGANSVEFARRQTAAIRRFNSALRTVHRIGIEEAKPRQGRLGIA